MKQVTVYKKSALAIALTLAYSQTAWAQRDATADAAADTAAPVQKVYVTGSNIAKIAAETATPVTVMRREDIVRTGANSVTELLNTLTASTGSLTDIGGSNSFAGGASSASLRNLGKQSTLILLNSRRVAPYALADYNEVFTNLDSLPLDAIERVEVLRSGGSALYGSDAVAGVINIITRGDFKGVQLKASMDESLKNSEFGTRNASITGGIGDIASDGYNVLANVEVFQRDPVMWRDIVEDINPAYGQKFTTVAPGSGRMFGNRGTPSSFSYPGNILGYGGGGGPIEGCTTVAAGLCQYDRFSRFQAIPEADRVNGMVSGKLRINEKLDAFAEAIYSRTETKYQGAFPTYDSTASDVVWGNPVTGERLNFTYLSLPAEHPLNGLGEPAALRYRFADAGGNTTVTSSQYRALVGLKGSWNDYDWETAAGVTGGKTKMRGRGAFSASGFKQVIGDYTQFDADFTPTDPTFFNKGYKIGQPNSAEVLNTLFPEQGYDGKITQTFLDGKISGEIAKIGGRGVGLAVGGEVRHEKFEINPTANLLAGDIVGNGSATANAKRMTGAAFAEIEAPVTSTLTLTGAARLDKYEDFDAHVSPKLAFRWAPNSSFLLRGTWEGGFRAPNLTESAQSSKFAFDNGVVDPRRCPQALALAQNLRNQAAGLPSSDPNSAILNARADSVEGNECAAGVFSNVRNNPDLEPETSRSATIGFVVEPFRGYNVALDYWRIERKDEIGLKSTSDLLAAENDQPAGVIERGSLASDKTFTPAEQVQYGVTTGPLIGTSGMFENVAKTKTSGIDLTGSARIRTPYGRVTVDANATYLLDLRYFSTTLGGYGDNLAGRYGAPKVVANTTVALETGNFSNALRVNFNRHTQLRGDFFDESFTSEGCAERGWAENECRVGSYVRWDYTMAYRGFKGWTLTAFVRNLFNHRPPVDLRSFASSGGGVIPQNYEDVQGRSLRLTAEYRF
ncbi:TonB-dependent receptor [Massilia sp. Dwa41.01b]|uniref:TonB-dependent receptor domain-containing protein n=1 Tax=unclassified Massilia TaxID=2609279 RepID=UPI0015FF9C63|nr:MULTISPECIES: TonB-dependent receptor [unclassified Massilia]QNA88170.1 TonB-dependent receptor [Massilia sp. Dwa41.01b]QNA99076.1 TonB-dependent receptor [Massilia sp. Se16.2.3]